MVTTKKPRAKTLPVGAARVLKRLHYPLEVILLCVRWCVAYSLSPRDLEEMMAERGFEVDHSSVHRWVIKLVRTHGTIDSSRYDFRGASYNKTLSC